MFILSILCLIASIAAIFHFKKIKSEEYAKKAACALVISGICVFFFGGDDAPTKKVEKSQISLRFDTAQAEAVQNNFETAIKSLAENQAGNFKSKNYQLNNFTGKMYFSSNLILSDDAYIEHGKNKYFITAYNLKNLDDFTQLLQTKSGEKVYFTGVTTGEKSFSDSGFIKEPEWQVNVTGFINQNVKIWPGIYTQMSEDALRNTGKFYTSDLERAFENIQIAKKINNIFAINYFTTILNRFMSANVNGINLIAGKVNSVEEEDEFDNDDSSGGKMSKLAKTLTTLGEIAQVASKRSFIVLDCTSNNVKYKIICWNRMAVEMLGNDEENKVLNTIKNFENKKITLSGQFIGYNVDTKTLLYVLREFDDGSRKFTYNSMPPGKVNIKF